MAPIAIDESTNDIKVLALTPKTASNKEDKHVHGKTGINPLLAMSHSGGEGGPVLASIPTFPTFAAQRTWQLNHLAAAFRHWSREGYVFGASGHISYRDPEYTNAFWTNPLNVHFGLLKASDMILLDLDGKVIGGNRSRPANGAGFMIHSAVHKARPDVHAACHCHSVYGRAWSVFGKPLEMLTQDTCRLYKSHSVYNSYGGVALAAEEGDRIAKALGPTNKGVILQNHGLLTVGETTDEAAWLFDVMEAACRDQLMIDVAAKASSSGSENKRIVIDDEEAAYNEQMEGGHEICYTEFQPYYDLEEHLSKGDFLMTEDYELKV